MIRLLATVAFGLSAFVSAESFVYENNLSVDRIYAGYDSGRIFFQVDREVANPNSCTAGGDTLLGADPTRGNVDHILSILLYAHAAQKTVSVQIYDSSCTSDHRLIRRIMVE